VQIATQNQFVRYCDVVLKGIDWPVKYVAADAGYGSELNDEYDRTNKYGATRNFVNAAAVEPDTSELYYYATAKNGNLRSIRVNPYWVSLKNLVKQKLSTE
jgi:hypothetical protein